MCIRDRFIEVETDEGVTGLGEATIEPFERTMVTLIEDYKRTVIGKDPSAIEYLWEDRYRGQFLRSDLLVNVALSAIEIACWDIKGKVLGVPCYELFGGPCRETVPFYGNYWFMKTRMGSTSVGEYAESAARAVENGFRALKWSPFGYVAHSMTPEQEHVTLECVRRVREAVGPDIQICFDMHTRLDTAHAVAFCKAVEPYRPFFIEDPLRSENTSSYRTLARHTSLPIAAGEQWASKWPFREVIEEELINYARIDLCIVGGITEALKITHWAETHYIDIVPHNPLGPVSAAACVALCMASTNVCLLYTSPSPRDLSTSRMPSSA